MKVLYVDHDAKIRNYISMLLESGLDLEVLECSSGNEAMSVCEMEGGIDFIISEVKMPNGNGDKLLEYFDSKKMNVPIIWLSDRENEKAMFVQESLARNSVNAFVPKPFKDTEFFPHIEKILKYLEEDVAFEEDEWADLEDTDTQSNSSNWNSPREDDVASWSLKKEYHRGATEDADWNLKKKTDDGWSGLKENISDSELYSSEKKKTTIDTIDTQTQKQKPKKTKRKIRKNEEPYDFGKYRKIRIKRFYPFNTVPCDVYIRLSESKYILIVRGNELYDSETLDRYSNKKMKYFYVPTEQHALFIDQVGQEIFTQAEKVLNTKGAPVALKSAAELGVFNHVNETVRSLGINENNAKKITKAVDYNLRTLSQHPNVFDLISKVMKGHSYLSEHSLLLSYICGEICLHTSWSSNQTLEKLSMASLLHDIAFDENDTAKIHDQDLDLNEIDEDDRKFIEEHPGYAAKLISSGKSVFPDVDTIVLQHHERPDGNGYPRKLGALSISPLACILIIAEDFVSKIFGKSKVEVNMKEIKNEFKNKYDKGNFKKPLQGFLSAFKED
ncbi:MAG: hypothetical protein OHK0056_10310 [Bacteriovoracaceae bacterium]